MKSLGVTYKEISIKDACIQHMKDIEHDESVKDINIKEGDTVRILDFEFEWTR